MKTTSQALEYEDSDMFKELLTPAKPKTKPVKLSVKRARRENRVVGEMTISEHFWYMLGRVWRAHWKLILFVLMNNGVWVYYLVLPLIKLGVR